MSSNRITKEVLDDNLHRCSTRLAHVFLLVFEQNLLRIYIVNSRQFWSLWTTPMSSIIPQRQVEEIALPINALIALCLGCTDLSTTRSFSRRQCWLRAPQSSIAQSSTRIRSVGSIQEWSITTQQNTMLMEHLVNDKEILWAGACQGPWLNELDARWQFVTCMTRGHICSCCPNLVLARSCSAIVWSVKLGPVTSSNGKLAF